MKIVAIQIDLARQKEHVSYVKEYVDFAKQNGYNTVFFYLEASVRTSLTPFFHPSVSYSMEELKEMVDYVESNGLVAVPAFENLYHMEKFLQYDQLAHLSEFVDANAEGRGWAPAHYPRGAVGCITNPALNEFMDAYISEICSLFHSDYLHMGLDEIFEFAECDRCKKVLAEGKTKQQLFLDHTMHCYQLCKKLGKRMMMWTDFFEYLDIVEQLPRDIILCYWDYGYIAEEPKGHWTNRVKRDWLRLFDQLGFDYMTCCWTTTASTILNVDSMDNYASKFSPIGKLFTNWEKESRFYHGNYPCMAYAGRLWSGKISNSMQDKVNVYAEYFGGNTEFARIVLTIQVKEWYSAYFDVSKFAETPYASRYIYNQSYYFLMDKLEQELNKIQGDKTVAQIVYNFLSEQRVFMRIVEIGNFIFDGYERGNLDVQSVNNQLDQLQSELERIRDDDFAFWQKFRNGIVSNHNALQSRWNGNFAIIDKIRKGISQQSGILYFDFMVPDCYSSVKGEIFVKYQGEKDFVSVHKGAIKSSANIFEGGGCYGFRYAIQNKPVQSVKFDVFGEGAIYPLHAQVLTNGKKYHPTKVSKLCGEVQNEHKILRNDTTFASMGYERAIDHLNNGKLCHERSSILLEF